MFAVRSLFPLLIFAAASLACDPATPELPDAGARQDSSDASTELDAGSFANCDRACRETTLQVELGAKAGGFDRVQFGYTSPEHTVSGGWELRLEAYAGGSPECPVEASPTPSRTLILSGVSLPEDETPQTKEGGVSTVLLDYRGELTDEPILRASSLTLTPKAGSFCPGCAQDGGAAAAQYFAFELDAQLPDGGISGQGFAAHCESMDLL